MSIAADNIVDAPPLEIGRSYAFNSITDGLELSGWSTPEATHVWSEGTDSRLVLDLPLGTDSLHCLFLNGFSLGPQTISSFVNGLQAGEARLDGEGEISVPLKLSAGRTDVRLSFSSPHVPGNGDPRLLAFALRALKVENCAK